MPGPTFSLVYATPLLQHQAQLGFNPALFLAIAIYCSNLYDAHAQWWAVRTSCHKTTRGFVAMATRRLSSAIRPAKRSMSPASTRSGKENWQRAPEVRLVNFLSISVSISNTHTGVCAFNGPLSWTTQVSQSGSTAEWLACWTQAQKGPGSNRSRDAVR